MALAASYRDIPMETLHYKDPQQNQSGTGKTAYIDIDQNTQRSPEFQLGEGALRCPFGARYPQGGEGGPNMNIELSLDDPEVRQFLDNWDEKNKEWIQSHPDFLGKKKVSAEAAADAYIPLVKHSKSDPEKYAPLCRVKVNVGERASQRTEIYVMDGTSSCRRGTAQDITSNCSVKAIVTAGSIFFVNRTFGLTMKAKKILVYPSDSKRDVGFRFTADEAVVGCSGEAAAAHRARTCGASPGRIRRKLPQNLLSPSSSRSVRTLRSCAKGDTPA